MGVYDQTARYAAQAEQTAVLNRLLESRGGSLSFREWLDTRALPLPGGADRTADLVAALDDPLAPASPWLLVLEFQAQPDPDKLDVTLEEVALLRNHARHGEDRKGRYRVAAALIYLHGRCPEELLDMTFPDGSGTRHAPLVWNVAEDNAAEAVAAVADGLQSWGTLFWVPLMAGAADKAVIARWKEVVSASVAERKMRGILKGIAPIFAELAGVGLVWKQELEEWDMITESQIVNEWIEKGRSTGKLEEARALLARILRRRFGDSVPAEVLDMIDTQPSTPILEDWIESAASVATLADFIAVLRR